MFLLGFLVDEDMNQLLDYDDFLGDLSVARKCTREHVRNYKIGRIKGKPEKLRIKLSKDELENFKELFYSHEKIPFQYEEFLLGLEKNFLILYIDY